MNSKTENFLLKLNKFLEEEGVELKQWYSYCYGFSSEYKDVEIDLEDTIEYLKNHNKSNLLLESEE